MSTWTDEDRLTYALQAEGPDEFPEGYYRAIAKERLALDREAKRLGQKVAEMESRIRPIDPPTPTHLLGTHRCDHNCVCRLHEHPEPLIWSDKLREHACADSSCANGAGMGYENPGGMPRRLDEHRLWWMVAGRGMRPRDAGARLGIARKRVEYLCRKWAQQGRYDYGVCIDMGWAEDREPLPCP